MGKSCECGCGLPVGEGKHYLNQAHKQKAYRARKRNQRRALSRHLSQELVLMLGDEKARQVFSYLNRIPTDKYNHELDKALVVILTAWKSERVLAS